MNQWIISKDKGFTLLEILVAISILAIAVVVVLQLFSSNLRSIKASEDYVYAAMKADEKMREVLAEKEIKEKSITKITDDGYRINVNVTEEKKEGRDLLSVKLLRIDVTVQWKKGRKEKSLSLSTLKLVKKI